MSLENRKLHEMLNMHNSFHYAQKIERKKTTKTNGIFVQQEQKQPEKKSSGVFTSTRFSLQLIKFSHFHPLSIGSSVLKHIRIQRLDANQCVL